MTETPKKNQGEAFPSAFRFTKMTGAGNDFLIFDALKNPFPKVDRSLFAQSLCRRSLSIGADGVVFLEPSADSKNAFKWDFYNADGSSAEFCGNAARCVARFAFENKHAAREMTFETSAGDVTAEILATNQVRIQMPKPEIIEKTLTIPVGEHIKIEVMHLNTGVPHVVKVNDDWDQEYLFDMGSYLRNHDLFKKSGGVNATFYEVIGPSKIHSVTFERGVENVTLACGTGAVAAALSALSGGMVSPVEVLVPGGTLFVEMDSNTSSVFLVGEARFICDGHLKSEALL